MTMKSKSIRFTDVGVVVDDAQGDRLEVDGHGPMLPLDIVAAITCTDVPGGPSMDSSTVWLDETATSVVIGFLNGKLRRFQAAERARRKEAMSAAVKGIGGVPIPCSKHDQADDDCATCGDVDVDRDVEPTPTVQSLYERLEKLMLETAEQCATGADAARWIDAARQAQQGAREAENRGV